MAWNPIAKIKAWLVKQAIRKAIGGTMFDKIWELLQGKKLYLYAAYLAFRAFSEAMLWSIPNWVDTLAMAFGIVGAKSAASKLEPK